MQPQTAPYGRSAGSWRRQELGVPRVLALPFGGLPQARIILAAYGTRDGAMEQMLAASLAGNGGR